MKWRELPALPQGRYMPLVHFRQGRIHCLGGSSPDRISPSTDHWSLGIHAGQPTESDPCITAKQFDLPDKYLMFPSQSWKHKNHRTLFRAIAELKRSGINGPDRISEVLASRLNRDVAKANASALATIFERARYAVPEG